ncbi:MAG: M23 family metallopeptidase [Gemmatimonadales bacterium]|nr:M23 family metallopeptidase [Gemmatimonadales bacterium]
MIPALALLVLLQVEPAKISVRVTPDPALIERSADVGGTRSVNFDFQVTNGTPAAKRLESVRVSVHDARGTLVLRRFCDGSGFSPCIATVPDRVIDPSVTTVIYNPFHTFRADLPLGALRYELVFADTVTLRQGGVAGTAHEDTLRVTVSPREYRTRTDLILPIRGRLLVFDGHDFESHHRRWPLAHPVLQHLGFRGNGGRYAYDFSIIDSAGRMFRGDGARNEDWYSWNAPVLAPGAGVVVTSVNDQLDWQVRRASLPDSVIMARPAALYGNYVVIDHGNGEFSLVAHMRQGTVRVQAGQRVMRGEAIGAVGFSGSVYTIHTHYQLQREADFRSEGLPSSFRRATRVGAPATAGRIHVNSGDILIGD